MSKLIFKEGDIFKTECEALVCPVNCFSIMGAGLAKLFRDRREFSIQNSDYRDFCRQGKMAPGSVLVSKNKDAEKIVLYLATKMDWKDDSKMEWIENGLLNIVRAISSYDIKSLALPAIGSGKGNLPWPSVELIIRSVFENDGLAKTVEVYLPHQDL